MKRLKFLWIIVLLLIAAAPIALAGTTYTKKLITANSPLTNNNYKVPFVQLNNSNILVVYGDDIDNDYGKYALCNQNAENCNITTFNLAVTNYIDAILLSNGYVFFTYYTSSDNYYGHSKIINNQLTQISDSWFTGTERMGSNRIKELSNGNIAINYYVYYPAAGNRYKIKSNVNGNLYSYSRSTFISNNILDIVELSNGNLYFIVGNSYDVLHIDLCSNTLSCTEDYIIKDLSLYATFVDTERINQSIFIVYTNNTDSFSYIQKCDENFANCETKLFMKDNFILQPIIEQIDNDRFLLTYYYHNGTNYLLNQSICDINTLNCELFGSYVLPNGMSSIDAKILNNKKTAVLFKEYTGSSYVLSMLISDQPLTNKLTISCRSSKDNSTVDYCTADIPGYGNYSTTTGTITTNISINGTMGFNITIWNATDSTGRPYINKSTTITANENNATHTIYLNPYLKIEAKHKYNESSLKNFTAYISLSDVCIDSCSYIAYSDDGKGYIYIPHTFFYRIIVEKEGYYNHSYYSALPISDDYVAELVPYFYLVNYSFWNVVNYSGKNYTKNLKYNVTLVCPSFYNVSLNLYVNNTKKKEDLLNCTNSEKTFSYNYVPTFEGTYNVSLYYTSNYDSLNESIATNETFTFDIYEPIINFTTNFTYDFRNNISESVNITVYDNISPIITCNISLNTKSYKNESFNNNQTKTYDFNLTDGNNQLIVKCYDLVQNEEIYDDTEYIYVKNITLINEDTGENFSKWSDMDTLRIISDTETYDFLSVNKSQIYIVTKDDKTFRLEKVYSATPSTIIFIDFRPSLVPTDLPLCVAEPQEIFEILIYSSLSKDIAVINNYAKCYVLADKTQYAYQDTVTEKIYSIKSIYYLYTYENGQKVFLASIDGGAANSIAIDLLESTKKQYSFSLTTDDFSIEKTSNTTLKIYYKTFKSNDKTVIEILDDKSNTIFKHTETDNPNEFTVYFDYTTLNISDLLTFKVTKYQGTEVSTFQRVFNKGGSYGILHPNVAMTLSIILIVFALTFVSISYVFGWFGAIALLIAIAITTLAPSTPELVFMQAVMLIILVFIILIWKNENYAIT